MGDYSSVVFLPSDIPRCLSVGLSISVLAAQGAYRAAFATHDATLRNSLYICIHELFHQAFLLKDGSDVIANKA